jgi:hypothetical protein
MTGSAAFTQGPPLIAVLPLQALGGMNAEQVGTVTRLLETGLVKSARFQVLERIGLEHPLLHQKTKESADCDKVSRHRPV